MFTKFTVVVISWCKSNHYPIDLKLVLWPLFLYKTRGKKKTFPCDQNYDLLFQFSSVQFSCLIMSKSLDPMDGSTPGLPVHHQLPELSQTHLHRVDDAIQPFHPLSSPYCTALSLSQYQGLFKWVSSSHQVAKVVEFQIQYQSFQWIFRTDFL